MVVGTTIDTLARSQEDVLEAEPGGGERDT